MDLLSHIRNHNLKIWVRLQPTADIFSTVYIDKGHFIIDSKITSYYSDLNINLLEFDDQIIDLNGNICEVDLVHDDQIYYDPSSEIWNGPIKNIEGVSKFHGFGRIFTPQIIYVGDIVFGHKTGWGKFYCKNGNIYVGQVTDGTFSGQGTYYVLNGAKYEGEFQDDQFNGQGKLYDKDRNLVYDGHYEMNVKTGHGILYLQNNGKYSGAKYIGQMLNGLRHGYGKHYDEAGNLIYDGTYEHNFATGQGTLYLQNNGCLTAADISVKLSTGREKDTASILMKTVR